MENKRKVKSNAAKEHLISICKINRYLSSGQVEELVNLKKYKLYHDCLTYDDGDNWWQ